MDTLVLKYSVCPTDRVQLEPMVRRAGGREEILATHTRVCSRVEAAQLSEQIVRVLREAFQVMGRSQGPMEPALARGHLEQLRAASTKLREALFPDAIAEFLRATPSIKHILFRVDPLLNGVVFDAIYLWDDFVAFRYATGKQLLTAVRPQIGPRHQPRGGSYEGCRLVDPDGQLVAQGAARLPNEEEWFDSQWDQLKHREEDEEEGCDSQSDNLKHRKENNRRFADMIALEDGIRFGPLTKADLDQAFQHHAFVDLVCHHAYDEKEPEKSGFQIGAEETYTARDLLSCFGAGAIPPLLFFSLACESAVTRGWEAEWPDTSRLYGMVDAVIRTGIRHYISAVVKIPAERSPRLRLPLYREIACGRTVGESLRVARRELRENRDDPLDGGTAFGLAFVLYGDPADAYFCAEGHRTDQQRTVGCFAVLPDGTICGKVVCPQERGFGQRRCNTHSDQEQPITCSAGHVVDNQDQLKVCKKCNNTVCPQCCGFAQALCSEHVCYNGHPLVGAARKICVDPHVKHPDEIRYVCPLDGGWIRGLCDECLAAAGQDANGNACPKCARWITNENPWSDVVVKGRAHQVCKACDTWDAQTEELQNILGVVEHFEENLATNLTDQTRRLDLMPKFHLSAWELLGPRPRILLGVEKSVADLSKQLGDSLRNHWQPLPLGNPWRAPDIWLKAYGKVNQCRVHELRGLLTRPVLVAVVSLHPVKIEQGRGAVSVPCDAGHLTEVENVFRDWWENEHNRKISNLYIVVQSTTGWACDVKPIYRSGEQFTILAQPQSNAWKLKLPPLDRRPEHVQTFVRLLTPKSLYQRRQEIRECIETCLKDNDFITNITAQEEIERKTSEPVDLQEVWEVFKQLAGTGKYRLTMINEKRALRPASPSERHGHWARRWWREIVVSVLLTLASLFGWLIPIVYKHQTTVAVGVIFAVVICYVLGQGLKRFALFLKQT